MIDVGDGRGTIPYHGNGLPVGAKEGDPLEIVDMVAEDSVSKPAPKPPETPTLPNESLVRAVLDGKVVQSRVRGDEEWHDMRNKTYALKQLLADPSAHGPEFRLKPETEDVWLALYTNGNMVQFDVRPPGVHSQQIKWWVKVTRERVSLRIVDFKHEAP